MEPTVLTGATSLQTIRALTVILNLLVEDVSKEFVHLILLFFKTGINNWLVGHDKTYSQHTEYDFKFPS